jgi:hypothetical protein
MLVWSPNRELFSSALPCVHRIWVLCFGWSPNRDLFSSALPGNLLWIYVGSFSLQPRTILSDPPWCVFILHWVDLIRFCFVALELLAESYFCFSARLLIFLFPLAKHQSVPIFFCCFRYSRQPVCPGVLVPFPHHFLSSVDFFPLSFSFYRQIFSSFLLAIGSGPGFCFVSRTLSVSDIYFATQFQDPLQFCFLLK